MAVITGSGGRTIPDLGEIVAFTVRAGETRHTGFGRITDGFLNHRRPATITLELDMDSSAANRHAANVHAAKHLASLPHEQLMLLMEVARDPTNASRDVYFDFLAEHGSEEEREFVERERGREAAMRLADAARLADENRRTYQEISRHADDLFLANATRSIATRSIVNNAS